MKDLLRSTVAILLFPAALACAAAQTGAPAGSAPAAGSASPSALPYALPQLPDMVCWGHTPDWSIQFGSWGTRYLGIDQPDRNFLGDFHWVPEDAAWVWQRTVGFAESTSPDLTAVIKRSSCADSVTKKTFPYSARVGLPQGDAVSGCCRNLKADEAPIGPQGVPPEDAAPQLTPNQATPNEAAPKP
jgi:uncharacterized membrane protein